MARYWFGDRPADFVVAPGSQYSLTPEQHGYTAVLVPGARLWAYDATTAVRVTDLLDDAGTPATEVTATSYGRIPRFRGPDGVQTLLLGQAEDVFDGVDDPPDLHKWILTSTEWPSIVAALDTRVGALEDGSSGGGGGDVIATAHPMIWSVEGDVTEDHVSAHPYWNDEGKGQTVTTIRAQATVTSGSLTCTVYTIDPVTEATTPIGAVVLDTTTQRTSITPAAAVSDGTGVTVGIERATTGDDIADVTVQVMIR